MRGNRRECWVFGLALAVATVPGCTNGTDSCTAEALTAYSVQVLGPDGSQICDAVVTEDSDGVHDRLMGPPLQDSGLEDAGCYYLSSTYHAGTFDVTAKKAGYLDAHGTTNVHCTGKCPRCIGDHVTLHLVPDPVSDGGPDAAPPDAGE